MADMSPGGSHSLKDHCELHLAELSFGKAIASGAFGAVFEGTLRGSPVAIKAVPLRALGDTHTKYLFGELRTLASVSHPHLLRFYGAAEGVRGDGGGGSGVLLDGGGGARQLFIVTEFMGGGTLTDFLLPPAPPLPWPLRVLLCLAAAVRCLARAHAGPASEWWRTSHPPHAQATPLTPSRRRASPTSMTRISCTAT